MFYIWQILKSFTVAIRRHPVSLNVNMEEVHLTDTADTTSVHVRREHKCLTARFYASHRFRKDEDGVVEPYDSSCEESSDDEEQVERIVCFS